MHKHAKTDLRRVEVQLVRSLVAIREVRLSLWPQNVLFPILEGVNTEIAKRSVAVQSSL